jgi:N-methylhydantoinase A/oxoprolinase/acetone carboxylase beta subunit
VVEVTVWRREGLMPGAVVAGPAVVAEAEATTWVGKGEQATIHDTGALEIEW